MWAHIVQLKPFFRLTIYLCCLLSKSMVYLNNLSLIEIIIYPIIFHKINKATKESTAAGVLMSDVAQVK